MLVIDGNMKNRRDVCAATEAGYVEYNGLPGNIKTGCPETPAFMSQYCYEHSARIGKRMSETEGLSDSEENVVAFITNKKQTRNGTYYQVLILYTITNDNMKW